MVPQMALEKQAHRSTARKSWPEMEGRGWLALLLLCFLLIPAPALSDEKDCKESEKLRRIIADLRVEKWRLIRIITYGNNAEEAKKSNMLYIEELNIEKKRLIFRMSNLKRKELNLSARVESLSANEMGALQRIRGFLEFFDEALKKNRNRIDTAEDKVKKLDAKIKRRDDVTGRFGEVQRDSRYYREELRKQEKRCGKEPEASEKKDAKKDGEETKPSAPAKPNEQVKPDGGKDTPPPRHIAIKAHIAQIKAAIAHAQTGIAECDRNKYEIGLKAARGHLQTLPAINLGRLSPSDLVHQLAHMKAAIAEAKALVAAIPPYPDPCEVSNIYYPALQYIVEQRLITGSFKWAAYVCDMKVMREYYDTHFAIDPALEAMRAEAITLAAGKAKPGTEEYKRRIQKGQLGILIRTINETIFPLERRRKKSDVQHLLKPMDHCKSEARHNRARMPTVEAWLNYQGYGSYISDSRARHKGKRAVPLPESVRAAAIAAGLDIPPFAQLPGGK
jgi:hypothetical protein